MNQVKNNLPTITGKNIPAMITPENLKKQVNEGKKNFNRIILDGDKKLNEFNLINLNFSGADLSESELINADLSLSVLGIFQFN